MVFVPGGLVNAVFSPIHPMPEELKGRKTYRHDERFCVRMMAKQMERFADYIGERLNKSKDRLYILITLKGWSEADRERVCPFTTRLQPHFCREIEDYFKTRYPCGRGLSQISEPAIAERAVEILYSLTGLGRL